jgi:RNA polymerase sigma-70 factor (sigma-E family)
LAAKRGNLRPVGERQEDMRASLEAEYTEYVHARLGWLRRTAYLLCQDWQGADDLAQKTITRLYTHWGRAGKAASLDAYVRGILVKAFLDERRSAWARRVTLPGDYAERPAVGHDADMRLDVRAALRSLPPRQRATVVLRYYCDCPIEEAAEILGVTPGTVKSQTAKGLTALRLALAPVMEA